MDMTAQRKKTILLVESHAVTAAAESEMIQGFGYDVVTVQSGAGAVTTVGGDTHVDLVLMDVILGDGIDGAETARRILSIKNIPIVFFTAHTERETVERLRGVMRYGYIMKNAGEYVLRSSIEAAFDLYDTHRKKSESEYALRTLLNTIPDLVWLKDPGGVYLACNRRFEELYGAPESDIIGKTDYDFVDRNKADSFRGYDRQVVETGKPGVNEEWLTFAVDGRQALMETIKTPMYGEDGVLIGVLGIARDISLRKTMENALHESEERFRTIFDTASDSIKIHDIETGAIVEANRASPGFYGYDTMEEFKENLIFGDPPYALEDGVRKIREASVSGPLSFEWINRKKDGSPLWEETTLNSIHFGGRHYVMAITRDISKRKQVEKKLLDSLQEKNTLLKEVHHRVKNNLQVISSLLALQSSRTNNEKLHSYFAESRNRIHAIALIHEMLYKSESLSKILFSRYLEELTTTLFSAFNVKDNVRLVLDVKDIRLSLDRAVPCALIINELLTNALKHAFPGNRAGEITVTFSLDKEQKHELIISDNGVGMPDSVKQGAQGSLGLEIVHVLVHQIGGSIETRSNGGSTVRIVF